MNLNDLQTSGNDMWTLLVPTVYVQCGRNITQYKWTSSKNKHSGKRYGVTEYVKLIDDIAIDNIANKLTRFGSKKSDIIDKVIESQSNKWQTDWEKLTSDEKSNARKILDINLTALYDEINANKSSNTSKQQRNHSKTQQPNQRSQSHAQTQSQTTTNTREPNESIHTLLIQMSHKLDQIQNQQTTMVDDVSSRALELLSNPLVATTEECRDCAHKMAQIEEFEKRIHFLESELKSLQNKYSDLNDKYTELKADTHTDCKSEIHNLKRQINRAHDTITELKSKQLIPDRKRQNEYQSQYYLNKKNNENSYRLQQQLDDLNQQNQAAVMGLVGMNQRQVKQKLKELLKPEFIEEHNEQLYEFNHSQSSLRHTLLDQLELGASNRKFTKFMIDNNYKRDRLTFDENDEKTKKERATPSKKNVSELGTNLTDGASFHSLLEETQKYKDENKDIFNYVELDTDHQNNSALINIETAIPAIIDKICLKNEEGRGWVIPHYKSDFKGNIVRAQIGIGYDGGRRQFVDKESKRESLHVCCKLNGIYKDEIEELNLQL